MAQTARWPSILAQGVVGGLPFLDPPLPSLEVRGMTEILHTPKGGNTMQAVQHIQLSKSSTYLLPSDMPFVGSRRTIPCVQTGLQL